jgi:uncharacterized damage-inducible protein DinB
VTFAPLDIGDNWARLNETIVGLIDYIPDGKLSWSPSPELFNFRGILLHVAVSRHNWLENVVQDGLFATDGPALSESSESLEDRLRRVLQHGRTKDDLKANLRWSWDRVAPFLSDPANLARTYTGMYFGERHSFTGNWIAFHLLEHDAHHRADLFHYLHVLGVEHPEVETP